MDSESSTAKKRDTVLSACQPPVRGTGVIRAARPGGDQYGDTAGYRGTVAGWCLRPRLVGCTVLPESNEGRIYGLHRNVARARFADGGIIRGIRPVLPERLSQVQQCDNHLKPLCNNSLIAVDQRMQCP